MSHTPLACISQLIVGTKQSPDASAVRFADQMPSFPHDQPGQSHAVFTTQTALTDGLERARPTQDRVGIIDSW